MDHLEYIGVPLRVRPEAVSRVQDRVVANNVSNTNAANVGISVLTVCITILMGINDNRNAGEYTRYIVADAFADGILSTGSVGATYLGAAAATAGAVARANKKGKKAAQNVPGKLSVIAYVGGFAGGLAYYYITEGITVNGYSAAEHARNIARRIADWYVTELETSEEHIWLPNQ